LVTNVSPLAPKEQIRRHFSAHGQILVFEPQIDKATGGALGVIFIKYGTHAEAAAASSVNMAGSLVLPSSDSTLVAKNSRSRWCLMVTASGCVLYYTSWENVGG
jgi:hypothetical protein